MGSKRQTSIMKLVTLLLCFALFAASSGQPLVGDLVDDFLKQILDLIKQVMPDGIPELGIPPLDPFEVPPIDDIHLHEDWISADIALKNLIVKNLSTFETEIAHLELEELSLELELAIPLLRGDAMYNLTGIILGLFPLYGDGPMWLEVYDLDIHAKAAVIINEEGYLQITQMDLGANFTDIKLHLDNILGGDNLGDSINNLLNLLGGFIWDVVEQFLFPFLNDFLKTLINEALDGCNIADLITDGACFRENMLELNQKIEEYNANKIGNEIKGNE